MMVRLYNEEGLNTLNKEKDTFKYFLIGVSILVAVLLILFICLAQYKYKIVFSITGSVVITFGVFVIIYLIGRIVYLKKLIREYTILFNQKSTRFTAKFDDISIKPMTLSDKTKAYEVRVILANDKVRLLYLSEIFDNDILIKDHTYKFIEAFDYIQGYEDEN